MNFWKKIEGIYVDMYVDKLVVWKGMKGYKFVFIKKYLNKYKIM